jgi:hypothetical protein
VKLSSQTLGFQAIFSLNSMGCFFEELTRLNIFMHCFISLKEKFFSAGHGTHAYNPSTHEAEAEGLSLRPALCT